MKWFRFYSEFVDDPKTAMMSDTDQLLWVKILCLASESSTRGTVFLTDEEISWKIRTTAETWRHAVDKFRAKGMIEHVKGGYRIVNWGKRQFASDDISARSKKSMAKSRSQAKTSCERSHDVHENVHMNVTRTDTDPDQIQIADPEKEEIKDPYKSPSATAAPPNPEPLLSSLRESENTFEEAMSGELEATLPLLFSQPGVAVYSTSPEKVVKKSKARKKIEYTADFEQFWAIYPRNEDKFKAFTSWQKIDFEEVSLDFVLESLRKQVSYHFDVQRKEISFFKMATTWLNGECWNNRVPGSQSAPAPTPQNLDPWTMLPIPLRRAYMLDDKRRGLTEEEFNRNQREQQVIWFAENGFPELSQKLALKLP